MNSAKYPNPLEVARKINAYNTKTVGVSKDDLPSALRQKFDEFSKATKATEDPEHSGEAPPLCWLVYASCDV